MNKRINNELLKAIISSNKFTIIMLCMIVLNFIMVLYYVPNNDFLNTFILINNAGMYNMIVSIFICLSTLNTIKICDSYKEMVIRYNSKRHYLRKMVKLVCSSNIIVMLVNYIILITFLNIFAGSFKISIIETINVNTLIYSLFCRGNK